MDGAKLKTFVIVPNKCVERALLLEGYNESNVIIYSKENAVKANENFEQHTKVDIQQIVNSWNSLANPDKVVSAFNQVGIYQIEITDNLNEVRWIDHQECKNEFTGNKIVPILEIKNSGE